YDGLYVLIIQTKHDGSIKWHAVHKIGETLLYLLYSSREMVHVVAVDVCQHRDRRRQHQQGTVGLVGLNYYVLAAAKPGVGAQRGDSPAHNYRGIESGARHHMSYHRSRRGLTVRPRDRDSVSI